MKRFHLFISNFLVYGIGSVIGKLIPLIMLPIITRLMPNTMYFGLNDISNILVSFGTALAVMGMYDAMFRVFFDKESLDFQKSICSSALAFTTATSISIFLIMISLRDFWAKLFFGSAQYNELFLISAISVLIGSISSIVAAPTRLTNKRKEYLLVSLLSSLISYSIAVPLLLKGYYIIAMPLSALLASVTMSGAFYILNYKWFSIKLVNWKYIRDMLLIAIPLMPNFLIYWVFNSADRLMIAHMLGNEAVGVYAIGGKIGQISHLIYTAFAGGWQYFAFSTMKDKDQVELTSNIFEYLGALAFAAGILMTAFSSLIFKILFTGDYVGGAIVAPYLFLSPLLLMLYQIGCNQFLIIKKTWPCFFILITGAVLNIALNCFLIPRIGIEGAAIATLLGYLVSVVISIVVLLKIKLLTISVRFTKVFLMVSLYMFLWKLVFHNFGIISISIAVICVVFIAFMYRDEFTKVFNRK